MPLRSTDAYLALDNDEFMPYFQPLVELRTGELEGFEVLARWNHPERGIIAPAEFIPIAEQDGWIGDLSKDVLRKACKAAASLPSHLRLAFNISPVQLQDLPLPKQIQVAVESAGISMNRITVEITESALAENPERARAIAQEFKAMGCSLALDDFGTGYSSLLTLQSLPFDQLKVDRSFVSSMADRRESRKIVAAVVGLGQSLGMTTIAEGVETREQAEMLLWLECNLAQGWFYGRPVPEADLSGIVAATATLLDPIASMQGQERRLSMSNFDSMPERRLAQLHAVYEGAPVGLAFLDRNLRYVMLNQRLAEINGVTMQEHLGRTVAEVIPEFYPQAEPYLLRALKGEIVSDILVKNGNGNAAEVRTTLSSYQPALDEAGEVLGVSIAMMDITALEQARESQRQSEENFRYMLDLSPQIPWVLDPEGRVLDVSQKWMEMTGMLDGEWKDFGWMDAVHPDDYQMTLNEMQISFATKCPIDFKYRARDRQRGGWRWVHARGSARLDDMGHVVCWYGLLEEVRPEDIRELDEERVHSMLGRAAHIPWVLDPAGKALDVSQQWLELTGMEKDEWRGDGWLNALHPDDRQPTIEVMEASFASGDPMDAKYRVHSPANGWVWMHAHGYARRDANGKVLYWYGTVWRQ
jgi:PAS domain S-box-containing protein